MSGFDPTRRRTEGVHRPESPKQEPAPATTALTTLEVDHHVRHRPNKLDGIFRESAKYPRRAALIRDLERLREDAQPWQVVRARLSEEEPSDLQVLYRTPGMKEWLAAIASPSQLVDTVERIGGPLSQQLTWLDFAGVTLAPKDARRELKLDKNDEAFLQRLDHHRSIAELDAEVAGLSDEESTVRAATPAGTQEFVSADYRTDRAKLEEARKTALREAGLDETKWKETRADFLALFRAHAITTAHRMLRDSAAAIEAQRRTTDLEALKSAIEPLRALNKKIAQTIQDYHRGKSRPELEETPTSRAALDTLRATEAERDALRNALAENYPVLRDPDLDLDALAGSAFDARRELSRLAGDRLADIEKMHGDLDADTELVFALDRVMDETKHALQINAGSTGDLLLERKAGRAAALGTLKSSAFAAVAIGLGLATGIGGAIGFAASAAGTSLSALSAIDSVQQYRRETGAARTDFDRARALASKEPSSFWLAVELAGTVLDAGAFAKTFAALHETARTSLSATSAAQLERARAALANIAGRAPPGSVSDVDELVARTLSAFRREHERSALVDEYAELAKAIAHAHPGLTSPELSGLLRLDDATRSALLEHFSRDPRLLAQLARFAGAQPRAAAGLGRLLDLADRPAALDLAEELSAWRSSDRARALLEHLGDPRVTAEDLDELKHALAAQSSPSAKARTLEKLARTNLPARPAELEAFAKKHGVAAIANEAAGDREVRVYFIARDGAVDDLQLEVGARATLADLESHTKTIEKVAEYRGLLGRARRFVDHIKQALGRKIIRPGTRAYRQALELQKLPEIIRSRQEQLAGAFTPARRARLELEVESLQAQLDTYRQSIAEELPELELDYVAALSPEARDARRLAQARAFPKFTAVEKLEGRTMAEISARPDLKNTFDAYYREVGQIIYRQDGKTSDVPLLRVESFDGRLRFAAEKPSDPPIFLPRAKTKEVAGFLERHALSWTRWKETLLSKNIISERELDHLVESILGGNNAPKTVDQLKDALKNATRDKFIDYCFQSKDSAERLRSFIYDLNSSDQGSIAELWYRRYSEKYLGRKIETHVRMLPADNPRLESMRVPDNLHVEGRALGEVKSTADGLSARDKIQIDAMLEALGQKKINRATGRPGAVVIKDGAAHSADRLTLTFIDPHAAAQSKDKLFEWLSEHELFTLEVFDAGGKLHRITGEELGSADALKTKLEGWTRKAKR